MSYEKNRILFLLFISFQYTFYIYIYFLSCYRKWIPGCGRALIDDGLNIFTEFGELTPYQILNLFIRFKSLPGYKTSPFLSCMDSILERIDENVVFETNTDFDELFEFCADPRAKGNKELTKNPEIQELHETDMKEKL